MKSIIVKSTLALGCLALISCAGTKKKEAEEQQGFSRFLQDDTQPGAPGTAATTNPDANTPTQPGTDAPQVPPSPGNTAATNPPPTQPTPPANTNPAAPATPQTPFGKPVPGKKGFVYSPFSDSNQMIDVRDYQPGTKVRDPYTNKIFIVP